MWNEIKERIKSKVVWIAVIAQVVLILGIFAPDITDTFKVVAVAIVEIATLFGVLNNPGDKDNF